MFHCIRLNDCSVKQHVLNKESCWRYTRVSWTLNCLVTTPFREEINISNIVVVARHSIQSESISFYRLDVSLVYDSIFTLSHLYMCWCLYFVSDGVTIPKVKWNILKGWLTFFLGLIVFMGWSLTCVNASFFKKKRKDFSHNLPLFYTALSLLLWTLMISCFYEAPPSEIHNGLWLVSWLSVLWFAKPPPETSRPSAQRHVLRLYCKQWRRQYCLSFWAQLWPREY